MHDRQTNDPTDRTEDDHRRRDADPREPGDGAHKPDKSNPLLREGADAPDAADIEQPERQR